MQIEQKVRELAAEQFFVDLDKVTTESTLESLGADSLDVVEFVMALEEEFDLTIEDEAAEQLDTIQGFVDLVQNLSEPHH